MKQTIFDEWGVIFDVRGENGITAQRRAACGVRCAASGMRHAACGVRYAVCGKSASGMRLVGSLRQAGCGLRDFVQVTAKN